MNTKNGILLGVGIIAVVLGITYVSGAFSYRQECVALEARLQAQEESNKSSLATHINVVRELAQVPEMYRDDLVKVTEASMKGRYGADGSEAVFQFIQEHNPNFDSSLYAKIETAIEAGRTRFDADQRQLMDIKREYEVGLKGNDSVFYGMWFHYPTIDLSQFKVVTNAETDKAFASGQSEPLKLRQ
jgi:hypothetical protein